MYDLEEMTRTAMHAGAAARRHEPARRGGLGGSHRAPPPPAPTGCSFFAERRPTRPSRPQPATCPLGRPGIPESAVKGSHRMGPDLPANLVEAIHRAETVGTARNQGSAKENPTRCWLEQDIREQESLYVLITKPVR